MRNVHWRTSHSKPTINILWYGWRSQENRLKNIYWNRKTPVLETIDLGVLASGRQKRNTIGIDWKWCWIQFWACVTLFSRRRTERCAAVESVALDSGEWIGWKMQPAILNAIIKSINVLLYEQHSVAGAQSLAWRIRSLRALWLWEFCWTGPALVC